MDSIKDYRKKIDDVDRNIVNLLSERFEFVGQIADHKRKNGIKIVDKDRERDIIKKIKKYSYKTHQKFFKKIFEDIISYSRKIQ